MVGATGATAGAAAGSLGSVTTNLTHCGPPKTVSNSSIVAMRTTAGLPASAGMVRVWPMKAGTAVATSATDGGSVEISST